MATYDDILGNGGGTPFPKGSKEWHEQQQDGSSAPPPVKGTQEWAEQKAAMAPVVTAPKPDITTTPPPPTKQEGSDGGALSYAELFKKLNPYTPPTDEELAKEKKKQKRDQIFAAIGDAYLLSPICTLQHRVHRICIVEKTQLRKGYRLGMID